MPLQIPTRKNPGTESFPTSPEDVRSWLSEIKPLSEGENQRLLYRGLKHSNRLENNNRSRVDVIAVIEPAVDQVLDHLAALYFEQPLPLPRKPSNAHQLASDLLREMGFAWKIVVNDTYSSLLGGQTGLRSLSIFHALRVIGKTILHYSLVYAPIPPGLLRDANNLYRMAEESSLHDVPVDVEIASISHSGDEETWTIRQAYVHIQMLSLASLQTHRRRQIPLLSDFLESISERVEVAIPKLRYPLHEKWLAIHMEQDTPAQPCNQYAPGTRKELRAFNVGDLMVQIHRAERMAPDSLALEMESSVLRRNTLHNLSSQLIDATERQHQRLISRETVGARSGLKEIHAMLMSPAGSGQPESSQQPFAMADRTKTTADSGSTEHWETMNRSDSGIRLRWAGGRSSGLQVGELVSVVPDPETHERSAEHVIGSVVWINYEPHGELECGIELLTRDASAVLVEGTTSNTRGSKLECLMCKEQDDARVVDPGNRSGHKRTLIAPPHTFQESGSVRMHHEGESSDWLIKSRKRAAGGYDYFELLPRSIS